MTGAMQFGSFEFETRCSICGKQRNKGSHAKCSKERQRRRVEEDARVGK